MTKYYTPKEALPKYQILEGQSRLNALMLELCETKTIITNIPFIVTHENNRTI